MSNFFKLCVFACLFVHFTTLHAQDKVTELSLDRDEKFTTAAYSKKNGFWAVTGRTPALKRTWDFTVTKFSPDLSKKEWEEKILLGMWSTNLVYDVNAPKYLYYMNETPGVTVFSSKKVVTQISPDGKITNKEHPKDEALNDQLFVFCDASNYYEMWTKTKSEDFVLVKYEHQTLRRSKVTINIDKDKNTKEYGDWTYSSKTDSMLLFLRYGLKDNEGQIQMLSVNINDGKIAKQMTFKPELGRLKIVPICNDRFDEGTERLQFGDKTYWGYDYSDKSGKLISGGSRNGLYYSPSAYGNIEFSSDGKAFYFYALVNFSGKKSISTLKLRPEGYILTKFDMEGHVLWSKQEKMDEKEVGDMFDLNSAIGDMWVALLYVKDSDAISLEIKYDDTKFAIGLSKRANATVGRKYDSNGNIADKCLKKFTVKPKLAQKSTTSVTDTESLMPCYSKNATKRVTEYIEKKGITGSYSVFVDQGSTVLTIIPKDDNQVVGCLYFKD